MALGRNNGLSGLLGGGMVSPDSYDSAYSAEIRRRLEYERLKMMAYGGIDMANPAGITQQPINQTAGNLLLLLENE